MRANKYETYVKPKLVLVEGWARDGLTDEQIANNLGIACSTLYEYKKKYPDFSEALKKGKEVVDFEVENALLKRALGYQYTEETEEVLPDGSTKTKTVIKHMAPDTTAQIFWLKNRRPDKWRDRKEVAADVNKVENPLEGLSTDELKELIKDG